MLHHRRRLVLENLESRRLLDGNGLPLAQPDANAALVTTFSDTHARVVDSTSGYFISTQRPLNSADVESIPTLHGDFNGDGVTDLLDTSSETEWRLSLNDGTQLYQFAVGSGLADVETVGTADFDQNGSQDVLSMDESGTLWVSKYEAGTFQHSAWGEFAHPDGWTHLFVDDFTGDGRPDVLGGEAGGNWWLAVNAGDGNFDNFRWGRFHDFDWQNVVHGDFTGDQIADVMTLAPDNTWWLWEGSESGFEPSRYFGHWKMRDTWHDVSVGDFNGDSIDDVIGRADDGTLWVGQSINDTLTTWEWGSGWVQGANWSQVTVMDINGDGLDDQLGHAQDQTWWYALSHGTSFLNHFWNEGGEADFVVQDFRLVGGIDIIDSFPPGGDDFRTEGSVSEQSVPPVVSIGPNQQNNIHTSNNLAYFHSLGQNSSQPEESVVESQNTADGLVAEIIAGRLILSGNETGISGFDVHSRGGFLSLETVVIPELGEVNLADPFEPATGIILANNPVNVTIVAIPGRTIDLAGETRTSILYSGPIENALDDLTVNAGIDFEITTIELLTD